MEKLPEAQHAIMAHFSDLGHAKDITFVHPNEYGDGRAVDALERLGYLQPVDLHYGECWLTLLDKGRAYRIAFFPTKDERIAELEANLADALEVSRIKGEELAAAIAENEEYRAALKPFAESVGDADVKASKDDACLGVEMGGHKSDVFVYIETGKLLNAHLRVRHLRAAAEVYAKFKGAGDE